MKPSKNKWCEPTLSHHPTPAPNAKAATMISTESFAGGAAFVRHAAGFCRSSRFASTSAVVLPGAIP
jgi:hypothetical protein